jgi:hypothetical protein
MAEDIETKKGIFLKVHKDFPRVFDELFGYLALNSDFFSDSNVEKSKIIVCSMFDKHAKKSNQVSFACKVL